MRKLVQLGLMAVLVTVVTACDSSNNTDDPLNTGKVTLSTDVSTITANGTEKVTFTVTCNSQNVTSTAKIYYVATGTSFSGNTFSTNEPGSYGFYAIYGGIQSDVITVTAAAATEVLTLISSSAKFAPDGSETITFTVKKGATDVTSSAKIKNVTSGEYLSGITYTSSTATAVTFLAEHDSRQSAELTLTPRSFYHQVGMFKFTSQGCGPCYTLGESLNSVVTQLPNRIVYVNIHAWAGYSLANAESLSLATQFGATSNIPDCRYDLKEQLVGAYPASVVKSKVEEHIVKMSSTGINATASLSGNTATLKVTVRSSATKNYYLGVILLEDGIEGNQSTGTSSIAYTHNNVFRKVVSGEVYGDNLGEVKMDGTVEKTYSVDLTGYTSGNCRFMIYSLYTASSAKVIDNTVYCSTSGNATYKFED